MSVYFFFLRYVKSLGLLLASNPKCGGLASISILSRLDYALVSLGAAPTTTLQRKPRPARVPGGGKSFAPNVSTRQAGGCNRSGQTKLIMQISPLAVPGAKTGFGRMFALVWKESAHRASVLVSQMKAAVGNRETLGSLYRVRMQRREYVKRDCRRVSELVADVFQANWHQLV